MSIWDAIHQHVWHRHCTLPAIQEAQARMRHVNVPTYLWDIFSKSQIALCKVLYDPEIRENMFADLPVSVLDGQLPLTLEQYFVDKHLSYRIPTEFLERVFRILPQAIEKDLTTSNCDFTRSLCFCYALDKVWVGESFRQEKVQTEFMMRVVDRLQLEEELKLFALPEFSTKELPKWERKILDYEISRQKQRLDDGFSGIASALLPDEERKKCEDYCKRFFDASHQRVLAELQRRWELDKAQRAEDPNALLLNLTTLEGFEQEIGEKRQQLYIKTTAATVIAVVAFFFARTVLSSITD